MTLPDRQRQLEGSGGSDERAARSQDRRVQVLYLRDRDLRQSDYPLALVELDCAREPPTSTSQRLPLSRSCSFADMTIIIEMRC